MLPPPLLPPRALPPIPSLPPLTASPGPPPIPPMPPLSIVVASSGGNNAIAATAINCLCRQRRRQWHCWLHPTTASIDGNHCQQRWRQHPCLRRHYPCCLCKLHCASDAPVDGCLLCCCPLPAASSDVQICQPPPSCERQHFCRRATIPFCLPLPCRRATIPFCLPLPTAVLLLFYRASIAFAAPVDGWLLHSPPTQQHINHITKLKTFPVSTPWTYFDLLRVSMCLVWCT